MRGKVAPSQTSDRWHNSGGSKAARDVPKDEPRVRRRYVGLFYWVYSTGSILLGLFYWVYSTGNMLLGICLFFDVKMLNCVFKVMNCVFKVMNCVLK